MEDIVKMLQRACEESATSLLEKCEAGARETLPQVRMKRPRPHHQRIDADDIQSFSKKPPDKMSADETAAARHQSTCHCPPPLMRRETATPHIDVHHLEPPFRSA